MHDVNDMLNIHDRHLTKINSNKFTLWMCPLFLRKFRSVLCIKENFICKEKSDLFLCKRKNKIFVKKNQIYFCVKFKKKKRFYQEKSNLFFMNNNNNKKSFLKEDPHSYDEFITHASHS